MVGYLNTINGRQVLSASVSSTINREYNKLALSTINPKFRSIPDNTRLSMTQERSAPGPDELPFWLNSLSNDREDRNTTLMLLTCHNLWLKRLDGLQLKWDVSKDLLIKAPSIDFFLLSFI